MKRFKLVLVGLVIVSFSALLFKSCTNEMMDQQEEGPSILSATRGVESIVYCGEVTEVDLLAGQHIGAGTVVVGNDSENLYVTYTTTGGWMIKAIQLYVGNCGEIPVNKAGNPQPGQFPYKMNFVDPYVTTQLFTIPLSDLPEREFCVAAKADVVNGDQNEGAWGEGIQFVEGKNWGMYFRYTVQECEEEEEEEKCYEYQEETAWGEGTRYVEQGNWATYSRYEPGKTIKAYAGQTYYAADITFSEVVDGKVTITIAFKEGFQLADGKETVKIERYLSTPPATNPIPGHFKYKGNQTTITVDEGAFYGIHLDVLMKVEVPCPHAE